MPAIIVSVVTISDPVEFQEYARGIAGLAEQFHGEYIARGPVTAILEGEAQPNERIVILRFPDSASAKAYVNAPTYLTAKSHRLNAAKVTMRLIET